ncbi:MAG: hypothetical protein EA382_00520 [Spirochaetaceae bacterium]|nr:MAG: hypothetical protein EA382_00520 [Spirochaetaceae bacterium]
MVETEKRQYLRKTRENTYCVLDDYEPQFEVVEISAHGFSFACAHDDARFKENVRLGDISVLNGESQEIIHATGVVRHRSGFDALRDRIGVSFESKRLDNTITGRVRLPRRRPSIELAAHVTAGDRVAGGTVVDYNIRSARLALSTSIELSAGDRVDVYLGAAHRRLYDGSATVVRTRDDASEIVVEFADNLLELRTVSLTEKAMYAREIIDQKRRNLDSFSVVSAEYKALVSDWRMFFEVVEDVLHREEAKGYLLSASDERQFLEEIIPDVFARTREFIAELNRLAPDIPAEHLMLHKQFFRRRLEPFLRRSPLACSIMDKIHGYHGDYETVKQFFSDPYIGPDLFGKLMNRFITSLEPVTAHVNRIAYLYNEICSAYRRSVDGIRILSLGSGPAEEILRLVEANDFDKPIHVALVDVDAHALADFYERIQYHQKPNVSIELVNFNVINILVGKKTDLEPQSFDITYCAGMFDYFKDRFCRKFIEFLADLTKDGGSFYYTNVHSRNFARYFMDYGGGWEIYHRDEQETLALAPPEHPCEVLTDETGTNIYVKGTRSVVNN